MSIIQCYKQSTKAISIYKNRTKKNKDNDRIKRSGENKTLLFPKHCMVCKKVTISFNRRKQHARFVELENAELAIRKAAERKKDNFMLTAIQGVESLRAAEFRIHEKCQKNYTKVNSPKKKRIRSEVNLEELDNEEHPKKRTAKENFIADVENDARNSSKDNEGMFYFSFLILSHRFMLFYIFLCVKAK